MRSLLLQVVAVTTINIKSIAQRLWLSMTTVLAIALVVMVLLAFLAKANGFQRTIAGSGAEDIAIVLRPGSQAEINSTVTREQVRLIEDGPGIARGADGKPLVSPELYIVVDGIKRSSGTKANLPLRGIGEQGLVLRGGIAISSGRMFNRGANEVVVGKGLAREFEGLDIGSTVAFGTTLWTVVGLFEAGGSVFESEIWADLPVVQSLFDRDTFELRFWRVQEWPAAGSEPDAFDLAHPSAAQALVQGVVLAIDGQERLALLARFPGDQLSSRDQAFFVGQPNFFAGAHRFVGGFEAGHANDRADHKIDLFVRGHAHRAPLPVDDLNVAQPFGLQLPADLLRILLRSQ